MTQSLPRTSDRQPSTDRSSLIVDSRPLTDGERALIAAATNEPCTWALRDKLARAVGMRGVYVGRFDSCGDLVEALERVAR